MGFTASVFFALVSSSSPSSSPGWERCGGGIQLGPMIRRAQVEIAVNTVERRATAHSDATKVVAVHLSSLVTNIGSK